MRLFSFENLTVSKTNNYQYLMVYYHGTDSDPNSEPVTASQSRDLGGISPVKLLSVKSQSQQRTVYTQSLGYDT